MDKLTDAQIAPMAERPLNNSFIFGMDGRVYFMVLIIYQKSKRIDNGKTKAYAGRSSGGE